MINTRAPDGANNSGFWQDSCNYEKSLDYIVINLNDNEAQIKYWVHNILMALSPRKHEFFNPCNSEAMALRLAVANTVLGEAIQWLEGEGEVRGKVKVDPSTHPIGLGLNSSLIIDLVLLT